MKSNSLKIRNEKLFFNYKTTFLFINLCLLILQFSCKKDSDSNAPVSEGIQTEIGIPDGESVSKVLGTGGGSIISSDNRFEIIIQPGVLSSDVSLSVQPITNTAPGATGKAYRIYTEESFNYPVTLVIHYTPDDIDGTVEKAMGIAVQDSVGIWHTPYHFTIDTAAKTISLSTTISLDQSLSINDKTFKSANASNIHYSDHSVYTRYKLTAEKTILKINEQTVIRLKSFQTDPALPGNEDDELAGLPRFYDYPNASNIVWTVDDKINGDASKGTVSGGNPTIYTAPSIVPSYNSVIVTAEISNIATPGDKLLLSKRIIIKDAGFKYKLTLNYKQTGSSSAYTDVYTDYAEMKISVVNYILTISDTINQKPNVSPASGMSNGNLCTYYWVPDNFGMLNIKSCSGYVINYGDPDTYMLSVSITQGKIIMPHWKAICNSVTTDLGETSLPVGPPIGVSFYLKDSIQEQTDGNYVAKLIPQ